MSEKYFTWFMKSRNKVDTIKGVDEHETYDNTTGEFVAKAGHNCLTFLDLDATAEHGKEQFRMATDKITTWSIK